MNRKAFKILIVDDEKSFLLLLRRIAESEGYTVKTADNGQQALQVAKSFRPHLILVDLKMPLIDGLTFMERYRAVDKEADFIMITAYATVDTAVKAMKIGALDYLIKPLKAPDELRLAIQKVYERRHFIYEHCALKDEPDKTLPPIEIIFAGMEDLYREIQAVAPTTATILLTGETGTGKSLIAKAIHQLSRRTGLFIEVNCASVPEHLLESEFFGHEKGAFTGATSTQKGKLEIASEGTIFLDEISEMHQGMQAKLLRALQDGEFERLGSHTTRVSTARVVCATNRNLQDEVLKGRFREDLFFRVNVFPLRLTPLRERKAAIPLIADYLVKRLSVKMGKNIVGLSDLVLEKLTSHHWSGNIRELKNVLERAIILSQSALLDDVRIDPSATVNGRQNHGSLKEMEKKAIEQALKLANGNRKIAAEHLGISIRTLQYKIKEYQLSS
jgi:DNA-binding NtrC family response regulator